MICRTCQKEILEGDYCVHCGTFHNELVLCDDCKKVVKKNYNFCPYCSTKLKKVVHYSVKKEYKFGIGMSSYR